MIKLDKKKIELIITGLAVIVLIVHISRLVDKGGSGQKADTKKVSGEDAPVSAQEKLAELRNYFGQLSWKRDPFKRVTLERKIIAGDSEFTLSGIIDEGANPRAIIGGKFLTVGDKIDSYAVLRIEKDFVIVSDGRKIYLLRLGDSLDSISTL
jgi:hypothetical protein